jgi:hypothetical protein
VAVMVLLLTITPAGDITAAQTAGQLPTLLTRLNDPFTRRYGLAVK